MQTYCRFDNRTHANICCVRRMEPQRDPAQSRWKPRRDAHKLCTHINES